MRDSGPVAGLRASLVAAAVLAVVVRPRLWGTAVRVLLEVARPRWWSRPPFLPVPDRGYLAFRLSTAYGGRPETARPSDLVEYLDWRGSLP